ncbi:MAG: hypothetical protein ACK533_04180 [Planctomycetota bacterium]
MNTHAMLAAAALLASLSAQDPQVRDPNHPLPPTASTIVSTPPLVSVRTPADPAAVPNLPAVTRAPGAQRRSTRPVDAAMKSRLDTVLFDQPVADGPLWARGHTWKASFDNTGFDYIPFLGADAPRNFPLRVELANAAVAGEPLALPAGNPTRRGFAVHTARGSLTEVVDLRLNEVEQSFRFDTLPTRGAVAVEVRLAGDFVGTPIPGGLRFGNEHGAVEYTKAVAFDANGRSVTLPIDWDGATARMEIPADFVANAALPLVLDPVLTSTTTLGTGAPAGQVQTDPDVATIEIGGDACRSLVVWRRQFSVGDQDCWAVRLDANAAPVGSEFTLDFTSLDWLAPAVAGHRGGQNFLVVSEIRTGTTHYIGGRLVPAAPTGTLGNLFDIERNGVVGLAGNNFRPDVGADPFNAVVSSYYCVVFEKNVGVNNNDIYFKLVQPNGTLLTTNPTALDTGTNNQSNPCISKSNNTALWMVAWQSKFQFAPFDEEIYGALINWPGTVSVPAFGIATTVDNETLPATSSPFVSPTGQTLRAVAFERATAAGQQRDIWLRAYDDTGLFVGEYNLTQNEAGFAIPFDQQAPDIDTDGTRLVVGWSEPFNGNQDLETKVSTVAFVGPGIGNWRIDESRVFLGGSFGNEFNTRICARASGGFGVQSPDYLVVGSLDSPNQIQAYLYGGYSQGNFFTTFGSACGASGLTLTASGRAVIGAPVSFTMNTSAPSGLFFGAPGFQSLAPLGCFSCNLGVQNFVLVGAPLSFVIPTNVNLVGLTYSLQGYGVSGTNCLGLFDLTDTIDMTIR